MFRIIALIYIGLVASSFSYSQDIVVYYGFSGLGSNMGEDFPVFKVSDGKFSYTNEVTSGWDGMEYPPADTVLTGILNPECLKGLETILKEFPDTTLYESNIGVRSGGVHTINLSNSEKRIEITLHNGWHSLAQRIVDLLNLNVPDNIPQLWLHDKKWGSEYAIKRVYELMDSMRVVPQNQKLKYISEYPNYKFFGVSETGYDEFAFEYIYTFSGQFFNAVNAKQERLIKDWTYIAARGLEIRLIGINDQDAELEKLENVFRERINVLDQDKKKLALDFIFGMKNLITQK